MLTRRQWLGALAAGAGAKRPNVLFLAVDDLRPELGCYGVKGIVSPNIDRLARRGLVFERAYCQQAVCSPSRSSVMTGARPDTTKVYDLVTHFRRAMPDVVTLPEHFKRNGYFTQGLGKLYHPGYDDERSWSVEWRTAQAPQYARRYELPAGPRRPNQKDGPAFESADVEDDFYLDGKVARMAAGTLGELSRRGAPFFLGVGFAKPHLPFVAPKRYWDLYDPRRIEPAPNPERPKGAPEYALAGSGELRNYLGVPAEGPLPAELARTLKHGYYASVSYMDAQLGLVLDALERHGLAGNTIVALWGDHGWKLGEHGEWCKHSNVENDTNAPLIVSAPGMRGAGKRTRALVEFVDIYPTLAELAGLGLPPHLEGRSLRPLLERPGLAWADAAFSQYPRPGLMGYSMRTERYRLTVWVDRKDRAKVDAVELYDHQRDPQENVNIAGEAANAALVARLMERWKAGPVRPSGRGH